MNIICSIEEISSNINESNYEFISNPDYDISANQLNFELNYNVKQLNFLANFYKLKNKPKNKLQLINEITNFESNLYNESKVYEFKNLMEKFIELKNNSFFKKYIIIPF